MHWRGMHWRGMDPTLLLLIISPAKRRDPVGHYSFNIWHALMYCWVQYMHRDIARPSYGNWIRPAHASTAFFSARLDVLLAWSWEILLKPKYRADSGLFNFFSLKNLLHEEANPSCLLTRWKQSCSNVSNSLICFAKRRKVLIFYQAVYRILLYTTCPFLESYNRLLQHWILNSLFSKTTYVVLDQATDKSPLCPP